MSVYYDVLYWRWARDRCLKSSCPMESVNVALQSSHMSVTLCHISCVEVMCGLYGLLRNVTQ